MLSVWCQKTKSVNLVFPEAAAGDGRTAHRRQWVKEVKFFRSKQAAGDSGWLGVHLDEQHLQLVRVRWNSADAKPRLRAALTLERSADLADDLRRLRKGRGMQHAKLALALEPGQYQHFQIDAPEVPMEEFQQAMRWRVKDMLAQSLDDSIVSALLLPAPNTMVRNRQAWVAAATRSAVAALTQPFLAAGFQPKAVDIPEMAQRNLAALCEDENRGLGFLYLKPDSGLLTLTWRGELFASRRLDFGSRTWTELKPDDADRRHLAFDRLTLELQRSLDHFERQFNFISVSRLVLAADAGEAALNPLLEYLRPNLYMPVALFDPAQVLELPAKTPQDAQEFSARFLPALGLALRLEA